MEDFVFKLVTAEGAGALLNLVICVQRTCRKKERKGAQTLMGQSKGRTGLPEIEETVCAEMTRKAAGA